MKIKRLKGWVLPSLYGCFFIGVFLVTLGVSNVLMDKRENSNDKEDITYVSESIIDDDIQVVDQVETVLKPYISDKVKVSKYYYDYKADEETQEKSLIYHDNTYMQNSGIDYTSEEQFDVISILNGTVTNVKDDELLGKCVEIKHDNNYTSVYQSLSEVNVKKGDTVMKGQLIGKSGENTLDKDMGNHLHFELYIKGQVVDPLQYVDKELKKDQETNQNEKTKEE